MEIQLMNIINRTIIKKISKFHLLKFQTIYELNFWYLNAHLCKNWFWQFEELVASMPCPKSTEPILRHLQTYMYTSWYISLMIAIGLMLLEQSIRFWPKNLQNHLFGISHCSKIDKNRCNKIFLTKAKTLRSNFQ